MSQKEKLNDSDLFDNPMVRAAMSAMSEEDRAKYKEIGKHMYGHLNFEDPSFTLNPDAQMSAARDCLEGQIRSGLHPSDMEKDEIALLEDAYGEEWYKKWGFVKEDLDDIVTVKKT